MVKFTIDEIRKLMVRPGVPCCCSGVSSNLTAADAQQLTTGVHAANRTRRTTSGTCPSLPTSITVSSLSSRSPSSRDGWVCLPPDPCPRAWLGVCRRKVHPDRLPGGSCRYHVRGAGANAGPGRAAPQQSRSAIGSCSRRHSSDTAIGSLGAAWQLSGPFTALVCGPRKAVTAAGGAAAGSQPPTHWRPGVGHMWQQQQQQQRP